MGLEERKSIYDEPKYTAINEALTQRITEGLLYGGFDVIDPSERARLGYKTSPVYENYRGVLAAIIENSNGALTLDMFIRAYFEDNSETPQTSERRSLTKSLRSVYGPGALSKIDELCMLAARDGGTGVADDGVNLLKKSTVD